MRKRTLLLLTGVIALVGSFVIGPSATATPKRASAGTVTIIHDQEPGILNPFLSEGNGYTVALALNKILAAGLIYNEKVQAVPELLDGQPKILKANPLTVTATYKKSAVWSDGKPITGADFVAGWKTRMNPNWDIVSRSGWEDIASVKVKGKSFTVTFKKGRSFYDWKVGIMGAQVMPAHKVAGQDFNKLWSDSLDIASGPFKFGSWQKGTQLQIVKNPKWAGAPAKIDRIVFRYLAGASQFQALKSGEGDVVEPQPQVQIVDFYNDKQFKVQSGAGYQWEHIDFQQGEKAAPALKQKYVRQAIITGINRAQIREVLYIKTGLVKNAKDLPVLQSHIYKPFEPQYKTPYARYKFSQKNAIAILKKNGCTGGPATPSASNSSIYSCPGVGKLSFAFTTTSGNPLRALTFEIIQKQLKSIGIEFTPRFVSPAVLFGGGTLTSGDWQIVMFTFLSSPSNTGDFNNIQGCGGDQNYMNACNQKASAILRKAKFTADDDKRAALLNSAEILLAEDVWSIPLFSRPTFLLNNVKVKGVLKNPTQQGSTWNAETWTVG